MSKIYIAAPLSTKEHKKNNEKVAKFLRFCGHEVYLLGRELNKIKFLESNEYDQV